MGKDIIIIRADTILITKAKNLESLDDRDEAKIIIMRTNISIKIDRTTGEKRILLSASLQLFPISRITNLEIFLKPKLNQCFTREQPKDVITRLGLDLEVLELQHREREISCYPNS
jgi:hypothetical protein